MIALEWKHELKKQAQADFDKFLSMIADFVVEAQKIRDLKCKIIDCLKTRPEAIFGTWQVLVKTKDVRIVHELAKALRCKFRKVVDDDGWNYVTKIDDITVRVFGFGDEVFGCRIVPRKVLRETVEYEVVCK